MKVLFWDRTGYCIFHKRLEQGTFRFPARNEDRKSLEVDSAVLTLILEGIDLSGAKRSKRYRG